MNLLGLDVGGTKCAAVAGTAKGDVLARREFSTSGHRGREAVLQDLIDAARAVLRDHACGRAGVSIGGPLDVVRGTVLSPPNLPGWDDVPLAAILARELGMPVRIEHDAAACARAEWNWGAGKGASRLAYLTCATGFGVGLLIDGVPYYGANGRSMEIGHVRYRDVGPKAFGKVGSFEAFGSARSLSRIAAWQVAERWGSDPPEPSAIAELARAGDPDAQAVVRTNALAVGDACAMICDLLGPDMIVLGSLARYLDEAWLDAVRERCRSEAMVSARIEPAALGERLQDLSAIAAALPPADGLG